jgi:hypothetical protein
MARGLRRRRLVDEVADQAPERGAVGVALLEVERARACEARAAVLRHARGSPRRERSWPHALAPRLLRLKGNQHLKVRGVAARAQS